MVIFSLGGFFYFDGSLEKLEVVRGQQRANIFDDLVKTPKTPLPSSLKNL
jgi:hypothetical protein